MTDSGQFTASLQKQMESWLRMDHALHLVDKDMILQWSECFVQSFVPENLYMLQAIHCMWLKSVL